MPDGIDIRIEGLADTKAMLENLSTQAAERAIRKALRAGSSIEEEAIRERAPVRPDLPSGTALPPGALANDISSTIRKVDDDNFVSITQPGKLTRHVANWVEYGHRLVRGGRSSVIKSGKNAGKTRGPGSHVGEVKEHPFIRPAYEATAEQVAQAIATTLQEEVTKASSK
ncbi:MAG TPA: HK97-gp10 family putative phage morphogenesis protein [Edaphobacter sp.]|nr:HK97-gp10 family putative phage morphogenesis protein [Edaphobacter sp.]